MLDSLLENKIIKLPKSKWPYKAGRRNDPKYYRYHRVISRSLEKCITLKDHIMQLDREGKIVLDLDYIIEANYNYA